MDIAAAALRREACLRGRNQWALACIGLLIVALVVANTLNIAADLVAIGSGMALLHAGPWWLWALIAGAAITALILLGGFTKIQQVFITSAPRAGSAQPA